MSADELLQSPIVGVPAPVGPPAQPLTWTTQYQIALVTFDLFAIIIATIGGFELRFGSLGGDFSVAGFVGIGGAIALGWLMSLQYCGGYEIRHLASGPEEAKRVLRASAVTVSVLAIACYVLRLPLARGFVVGVIPLGAVLLLIFRTVLRRYVDSQRRQGQWIHRIVAVGTRDSVQHLITTTERAPTAGLRVVGVCVEDGQVGSDVAPGVQVLGGILEAAAQAAEVDADVVAVTGSGLGPMSVRELGWALEGTGRGLVMAPALTEIAGTRMRISPVEGLPLMWLEEPRLGGMPRLLKRVLDTVGALGLMIALSPVLLCAAVAVQATSRGPVFFRQRRLGVNGKEFSILKFRSMYTGAEAQRAMILELNEQDGAGVLFKIRNDPRITPVGRWLRKFSIDELPQLIHVITGTMSLVGPRPLAAEDSTYDGSARRRLMVRPGLTGLWQISGRSDLSWDDAVRLDLYYVENWSVGLDISILFRTLFAVMGRRGAY